MEPLQLVVTENAACLGHGPWLPRTSSVFLASSSACCFRPYSVFRPNTSNVLLTFHMEVQNPVVRANPVGTSNLELSLLVFSIGRGPKPSRWCPFGDQSNVHLPVLLLIAKQSRGTGSKRVSPKMVPRGFPTIFGSKRRTGKALATCEASDTWTWP